MSNIENHTPPSSIQQIMDEADCLFSYQEVELAIARVATDLSRTLSGQNPILISVMNGGLVFSGHLLTQLSFPLQVDYLHATRYRNEIQGGRLDWRVEPSIDLNARVVVIVDDILDEGHTLQAIRKYCQSHGAARVYTAVLVDKAHQRKAEPGLKADFEGLRVADRFVFGFGMDYQGYWRNAPGIYAVKGL